MIVAKKGGTRGPNFLESVSAKEKKKSPDYLEGNLRSAFLPLKYVAGDHSWVRPAVSRRS